MRPAKLCVVNDASRGDRVMKIEPIKADRRWKSGRLWRARSAEMKNGKTDSENNHRRGQLGRRERVGREEENEQLRAPIPFEKEESQIQLLLKPVHFLPRLAVTMYQLLLSREHPVILPLRKANQRKLLCEGMISVNRNSSSKLTEVDTA